MLVNKKEKINTEIKGKINNKQKNIKVSIKTRKVVKNEYVMPEPKNKIKEENKKETKNM